MSRGPTGPSRVQGSALAVGDLRPQTEESPTRLSRNLRFRRNSLHISKGKVLCQQQYTPTKGKTLLLTGTASFLYEKMLPDQPSNGCPDRRTSLPLRLKQRATHLPELLDLGLENLYRNLKMLRHAVVAQELHRPPIDQLLRQTDFVTGEGSAANAALRRLVSPACTGKACSHGPRCGG